MSLYRVESFGIRTGDKSNVIFSADAIKLLINLRAIATCCRFSQRKILNYRVY